MHTHAKPHKASSRRKRPSFSSLFKKSTYRKTKKRKETSGYTLELGYPTAQAIEKAYDETDLHRAIQAYRFFYPTVSFAAGFFSSKNIGAKVNRSVILMKGSPQQIMFTPNSDTPYAIVPLDLTKGPMVVEIPAGSLMCVVNDLNQRYVMDMGLPGPDAGKGGKHLIIPPGYHEKIPSGYHAGVSTTNHATIALRAIPLQGDVEGAISLMKKVKVHPLHPEAGSSKLEWIDVSGRDWDSTVVSFETNLKYWELLHHVIDTEPPFEAYRMNYGDLATLGIRKGKPFKPNARMKAILEEAARIGNAQMRVQAFADRRPDCVAWKDRKWEWASLRYENGTFDLSSYQDLEAREKWFYQAVVESPAMFRRDAGAGSLYWLGLRDKRGAYLDGGKTYRLNVPLPVPAHLFWSVTVYDVETRSQVQTKHNKAALRSLFELKGATGDSVDLYFGPSAPHGAESKWIQTIPGKGWFCYFRIYGPEKAAFDSSWKPGDFEWVK